MRSHCYSILQYFHTALAATECVCRKPVGCPDDARKLREIIERKRIFKFLMGLTMNQDEVRGRILGMKPLLNIREVFSEVAKKKAEKR
ncbi:hypothetical protein F511_40885 [Dorcoceras hygrometricum]|uniref:Uncharacterized protein n=1 Tax=Dorcoceras hygrometricum TaxID=472368 RepID=A0A2Z7A049_9LAMI|nr:hypothetical protein F511_40885 [Dorcoceras hygrometricum]